LSKATPLPARTRIATALTRPRVPTVAVVLIAAVAAVLLLVAGRRLTFFFDEWDFILGRRGSDLGTFLDPHNGHLSLFPVLVYKLLLALFGMRHYWPYRVAVVVLHLACAGIVYVIARPRLGPWLAILPVTILLFLGSAFEDLLWPFQVGFLGSTAGGLGALAALDRRPRHAETYACTLLAWSLSSSGVGVAFLIAVAVMLVAQQRALRNWWVVVLPAALFGLWYLGWGGGEKTTLQAVLGAPQYVADASSAAFAGIAGLSAAYGPALGLAAVAAVVLMLRRRSAALSPLAIAAASGALAFWALSAIARADAAEPGSSRYIYVGAVLILIVVADAASGIALSRSALAVIALAMLGGLVANVKLLRDGERGWKGADASVRASLAAVEVAAPVVAADFVAEPQNAPQIQAGPYLSALRSFGSPALTLPELESAAPSVQAAVDGVLERAELRSPRPSLLQGGAPPAVEAETGGPVARRHGCDLFGATGPRDALDIRPSAGGGLLVRPAAGAEVSLYVRRFAPAFAEPPFAQVTAASLLTFPRDRDPGLPWHVRLTSAHAFTVCAVFS
jgi:hypothetical protein